MKDEQWLDLMQDAVARWNKDPDDPKFERLAKAWTRTWKFENFWEFEQCMKVLERKCRLWPSMNQVHEVLDDIKTRTAAQKPGYNALKPDPPMTVEELTEMGDKLHNYADKEATRPSSVAYFHTLGDFYITNAERVSLGQSRLWPPPPMPGPAGAMLDTYGRGTTGKPPKREMLVPKIAEIISPLDQLEIAMADDEVSTVVPCPD